MDNNTLSKYGWVIITAVVVAIIIAGSPAIGDKISDATIGTLADDIESYSVVLDPNGGTVAFNDLVVVPGKEYGYIPNPILEGRAFLGWYTSSDGGQKITSQTIYSGTNDHVLYARWE